MSKTNEVLEWATRTLTDAQGDLEVHQSVMRELERAQKERERAAEPPTARVRAAPPIKSDSRRSRPAVHGPSVDTPVIWGEEWRGLPNELARTGLFNIKQAEPRRWFDNEPIATLRHTVMLYSGPELRVRDEDVLLQCFHFQRHTPWGEPWCVNGRDFLIAMHWSDGRRGYRDLYESLLRLSKGHISILRASPPTPMVSAASVADVLDGAMANASTDAAFVLKAGSLIEIEIQHSARGAASVITISLNKQSLALWRTMGYTLVNWEQRLALTAPLARFLHRFYSSHREPFALKVNTLRQLTGSSTASLAKFRQLLRGALEALVDVGFLSAYWLDTADLVHVTRLAASSTALRR